MKELGIAIVGSGRMGELRGHMAKMHPAVRFLACSDVNADRAQAVANKIGAQLFSSDNSRVIRHPEVNAVIVSASENFHVAPVLEAIELGKPVLCEKPIALSLQEADQVMEGIKRHNGDVRYGYSRRFKHRYLSTKEQIASGRLGRLVGGHARAYNLRAQARQGAKRTKGMTPVVYSLTYYIDLMCWFFEGNPVIEVFGRGQSMGRGDGAGESVHDVTWAILKCADGAVINTGICYALPEKYPSRGLSTRVELIGSEGLIMLDGDNTDQIMYTERGIPHVHLPDQDANMVFLGSSTPGQWALGEFWGPLATETRAWLDYLATGNSCVLATAQDARRNLEISLAIEHSEYTGELVRLPLEP